ncbi:hypothetical protein Hdeb2414_s0023g00635311 [Helianthus debilis subsp. tardiflorus]
MLCWWDSFIEFAIDVLATLNCLRMSRSSQNLGFVVLLLIGCWSSLVIVKVLIFPWICNGVACSS